jgi:hypothetical protein
MELMVTSRSRPPSQQEIATWPLLQSSTTHEQMAEYSRQSAVSSPPGPAGPLNRSTGPTARWKNSRPTSVASPPCQAIVTSGPAGDSIMGHQTC